MMNTVRRVLGALTLTLALPCLAQSEPPERPRVYAITEATVVTAPGETLSSATVVLRDGLIEAVGTGVKPPADAEVISGQGLYLYPGFIDPDTDLGRASSGDGGRSSSGPGGASRSRRPSPGSRHPLGRIHPEWRTIDHLLPFEQDGDRSLDKYHKAGFTMALTTPEDGILQGRSAAVLLLADLEVPRMTVDDNVALHVAFERGSFGQGYPTSLMGTVAAVRQAFFAARRYAEWHTRYEADPRGMKRPDRVPAYEALADALDGKQKVYFRPSHRDDAMLAHRIAEEFGLDAVIGATGHEWEIAERLGSLGLPVIWPVAFPDKPKLDDPDEALSVSLRTMRRYTRAAEAPAMVHGAGVELALTTRGLKSMGDFRDNIREMVEKGLPEEAALAGLTTVPARLLGLERVAGSLERGKMANLVAFDGPWLGEESAVRWLFVDGVAHEMEEKLPEGGDPDAVADPRGAWDVTFDFGSRSVERRWEIEGDTGAYEGSAETGSGEVSFERIKLVGNMLTVLFPAREGRPPLEMTVVIDGDQFEGTASFGPRNVTAKGVRRDSPDDDQAGEEGR